ncbi:MAG: elongation factor P [Spirochaetota bacterium]|nr:elongation factor P [Spirochaetota bacterium]
MLDTTDISKGLMVEIDGAPYTVVEFQFVNPGKGSAFTRCRFKNLLTGAVLDRTYKSGEKLQEANVEEKMMEYIYYNGESYAFMDNTSYEQIEIPAKKVGDAAGFMKENTTVKVLFYNDVPVSVTLPIFVELEVSETIVADKGNTVTTSYKPATLATGGVVQVPMFVKTGDVLKIDTRDKSYVERL